MNKVPLALLALFGVCAAPLSAQDAPPPPVEPAATEATPPEAPVSPNVETTTAAPAAAEPKPEPKTTPRKRGAKAPEPATPQARATPPRQTRRVPFAQRSPTPTPVAGERKLSFFERIFGRRRTPSHMITPAPSATPATPKPRSKRRSTPAPADVSAATPDGTLGTPAPEIAKTNDTPQADAANADSTPEPVTAPPGKTAKTSGRKNGKGKPTPAATSRRPLPPPPTSSDPDVQEKYRYEVAKAKAQDDPNVSQLKDKADSASNEDEARKAQRAYNKALFQKMRSVDGSLKERIDRIESGILKRLEEP
ncbi:MAG TPA: hypothetical protein VGO90_06175 [Chthoniobacteraceae bacterium]|nr:hypothetical protein [Chthoniobacteraceae bacterium]